MADSILALPFLDSGVLLAALAARTRRIQLGAGCLASLGLRHPVTVARFEESVTFLRAVSSGSTSFHGPFTDVDDLDLGPGFVQRPFPVWLTANPSATASAATVDRLLARVARLGDGWLTFNVTPELLAARVRRLRELRASLNSDPAGPQSFPVCVYLNANVGPVASRARDDARERWSQSAPRGVSVDDLAGIAAVGSPEQAADLVGRLVEAGATHLAIEPLSTSVPRQAEALTELLLPRLHLARLPAQVQTSTSARIPDRSSAQVPDSVPAHGRTVS